MIERTINEREKFWRNKLQHHTNNFNETFTKIESNCEAAIRKNMKIVIESIQLATKCKVEYIQGDFVICKQRDKTEAWLIGCENIKLSNQSIDHSDILVKGKLIVNLGNRKEPICNKPIVVRCFQKTGVKLSNMSPKRHWNQQNSFYKCSNINLSELGINNDKLINESKLKINFHKNNKTTLKYYKTATEFNKNLYDSNKINFPTRMKSTNSKHYKSMNSLTINFEKEISNAMIALKKPRLYFSKSVFKNKQKQYIEKNSDFNSNENTIKKRMNKTFSNISCHGKAIETTKQAGFNTFYKSMNKTMHRVKSDFTNSGNSKYKDCLLQTTEPDNHYKIKFATPIENKIEDNWFENSEPQGFMPMSNCLSRNKYIVRSKSGIMTESIRKNKKTKHMKQCIVPIFDIQVRNFK